MKKYLLIFFLLTGLSSCIGFEGDNPYASAPELGIQLRYEEEPDIPEGVTVDIENMSSGAAYKVVSGADGMAKTRLTAGRYRISATYERTWVSPSGLIRKAIYNGSVDNFRLVGDARLNLTLSTPHPAPLLIKEIYSGGCKKLPEEGDYQSDKYMIIHNNSAEDQYLDSLCVGCLAPYNSTGNNYWVVPAADGSLVYSDYAPIIQALWQFPGRGTDFVLHPGEDAVVCFNGAIDHTRQFPLSVNLDKADYFVCYDAQAFDNPNYHPAPGPNIRPERIMTLVVKLGRANAYTVSVNSPALVIFRAQGMTIQDFVADPANISTSPGSVSDKIVNLPWSWVMDGVEVFTPNGNNIKRLLPKVDMSSVTFSQSFLGHTLMRKADASQSAALGYEVLIDSNNSSQDFYERETQSLHE